jgi:hypothetical protein
LNTGHRAESKFYRSLETPSIRASADVALADLAVLAQDIFTVPPWNFPRPSAF